ncbi:5-formyltetrahydrofolate cyclo-ligase [Saccharibacillus sp. O16]|nr:5-formyltetrahydrofolate cyclo-ligase [Saccharibacillus sp. O16]
MEQARAAISPEARSRASIEVCRLAADRLDTLRERKGRPLVLLGYLPYRGELDIRPLLEVCRAQGDVTLAPRIVKGTRSMRLLHMHGAEDEETGSWGIPEPREALPEWPEERLADLDVVLVPGLAFDWKGGRIGYGGGFYDRLSERLEASGAAPLHWALAYEEQVIDEVPMEPHDFRVELLIVPSGMTNTTDRI